MPLTREGIRAMFAAAGGATQERALLMLMRYSGLAIRNASTLRRDALDGAGVEIRGRQCEGAAGGYNGQRQYLHSVFVGESWVSERLEPGGTDGKGPSGSRWGGMWHPALSMTRIAPSFGLSKMCKFPLTPTSSQRARGTAVPRPARPATLEATPAGSVYAARQVKSRHYFGFIPACAGNRDALTLREPIGSLRGIGRPLCEVMLSRFRPESGHAGSWRCCANAGRPGTDLARALFGTIRALLLKVAATVRVNVRRIRVSLSSVFPRLELFAHSLSRLRAKPSGGGLGSTDAGGVPGFRDTGLPRPGALVESRGKSGANHAPATGRLWQRRSTRIRRFSRSAIQRLPDGPAAIPETLRPAAAAAPPLPESAQTCLLRSLDNYLGVRGGQAMDDDAPRCNRDFDESIEWSCGVLDELAACPQSRRDRMAAVGHRQMVVLLTAAATPSAERAARPKSRMLQRDRGPVAIGGRSAGEGADNHLRGRARGRPGRVSSTGAARRRSKKRLRHRLADFAAGVETAGDAVIAEALCGEQDHLGAGDSRVRQRIAAGAAIKFATLLVVQHNGERALAWHEALSARNSMHGRPESRKSIYVSYL